MPDADKVNTPATDPAVPGKTEQSAQPGQAADPAPKPELTALQQELARERQTRIEQERAYNSLRSKFNERDQELATLRNLRDSVLGGKTEDTSTGFDPEIAGEVLATREEVAWMRFQQMHPQYAEYWDEMKTIAGDPVYKRTIESYRVVKGQPVLDTFATLHNAYNEVELRRIKKAQSEAASKRSDAAANSKKIVSQAVISGSGAASDEGEGSGLTLQQIMDMDYNDLIKHPEFRQHINPNDPPRGI